MQDISLYRYRCNTCRYSSYLPNLLMAKQFAHAHIVHNLGKHVVSVQEFNGDWRTVMIVNRLLVPPKVDWLREGF